MGLSTGVVADRQIKASEFVGEWRHRSRREAPPAMVRDAACGNRARQPRLLSPRVVAPLGALLCHSVMKNSSVRAACLLEEGALWRELKPVGTPLSCHPRPPVNKVPEESLPGETRSLAP